MSMDQFLEQSGLCRATVWKYGKAGWLSSINIAGRLYFTRAEIARFNARAARGEFAKAVARPREGNGRLLAK